MSLSPKVMPLRSNPGIQRDITKADSKNYIDGQWCRFYSGLPRKIGGYSVIDLGNPEIIRSMYGVAKDKTIDAYLGRASTLAFVNVDNFGIAGTENDRTPTSGFVPNPNNTWSFDLFTSTLVGREEYIVATAAPNANDISNRIGGNIFFGNSDDNLPLQLITAAPAISGGIVYSSPFLIAYGNGGIIQWSAEGDISSWPSANFVVIDNTKIVQGINTRGGGTPTILFWSLNKLIRVSFNSTLQTFVPDIVEPNISIMSANSVVTYEQITYWIGNNSFYSYTGIVQIVPNTMNSDWFFNNLNRTYQSKVFGIVNSRYGEIWWFFPFGDSTECNAVIILQTKAQIWYDSKINRSSGLSDTIIPYPLLSDNQTVAYNTGTSTIFTYPLWVHEFGHDKIILDQSYAIDSYFESHLYNLISQGINRALRTTRVEIDFNQLNDMSIMVNNREFSQSIPIPTGPFTFDDATVKVDDVYSQGFFVSYQIRSNILGGYYQMGNPLLNYEEGDYRR